MVALRIKQNGEVVVRVEGNSPETEASILHYAMQYRQDGDVTIEHNAKGYWKRWAFMCQWPIHEAPQ